MNLMELLNQVKVTEEIYNYFIDIIVHFSMVKFFLINYLSFFQYTTLY
jgi:hypothetical protein